MVDAVQDIQDLNRFILNMGDKFRAEITRSVGPSPSQFPVNQSFSLATSHLFLALPQVVRKRLASLSPGGFGSAWQAAGDKDFTALDLDARLFLSGRSGSLARSG